VFAVEDGERGHVQEVQHEIITGEVFLLDSKRGGSLLL